MFKLFYFLFFYYFFFLNLLISQENQVYNQDKDNFQKKINANAGEDIIMPAGSVILLDASESTPKKDQLIYKWSFPPNFIFSEDYDFNENDSIEYYDPNESNSLISIKNIKTQTKIIEIELPMQDEGSKVSIGLKVENSKKETNQDVVIVKYLAPIKDLFNSGFSQDAVENTDQYNYYEYFIEDEFSQYRKSIGLEDSIINSRPNQIKINTDFLSVQPINKQNLNPLQIEAINKVIYDHCIALGLNGVLDPNREIPNIINTKKIIQKDFVFTDTLIVQKDNTPRLKKWLKKFKTNPDTSEGIDKNKLDNNVPNSVELINDQNIVADTLVKKEKKSFIQLTPETSKAISKLSYNLKKLFFPKAWLENIEKNKADSLNAKTSDISSVEKNDVPPLIIKEEIKIKPEINYIVMDTSFSIDTLLLEEIKDLSLKYNFDCKNDSCASENALLEGVGQLLTWSITNSSVLVFNYYNISNHLIKNPQWIWRSSARFYADATQKVSPPDAMLLNNELSESSIKIYNDSTRVYLSKDISNALREVLLSQIMENKNFKEGFIERNRKVAAVVKKKPIIFVVSLAAITQGVISLLRMDKEEGEDLPPNFP